MMFLVIFGSLTAAMAVVAQGNLRTADSAMKVSRAMSAAETGLIFAARRLEAESSRFVVEKGVIDSDFGHDLWLGTYDLGADGAVVVLPPVGYTEAIDPLGVMDAVYNAHLADSHDITPEPGDTALPEIDLLGTLRVRPIALTTNADGTPSENGPYFRVKYELIVNAPYLRITSQGVDRNITRTLQMDFRIDKKIEFAIISPNRIMIGKNVRIEGPLGSRYGLVAGELDSANGDPLVMRSDFYDLPGQAVLDVNLDTFFTQVAAFDVDGDGRLRPDHPIEVQGINAAPGVLVDYDLDEYVDDFDLFLAHFDANTDRRLVLADEFMGIDDQLARLIDEAYPDRDGDGVTGTATDIALGYNDGVIDANDLYAKVHGRLVFAVARATWEAAHGDSYQTIVHGPVRPGLDQAPAIFEADEEELRELSTDMFTNAQTWFETQAFTGLDFAAQVANGEAAGGTYTPPGNNTWEDVPFGAQAAGGAPYDYYQRPIYDTMTFTNVRIPMGNNGLFRDCTFIGVTYIITDVDCGDTCVNSENWNYKGALEWNDADDDQVITTDEMSLKPGYDTMLPPTNGDGTWEDTRLRSNNVRFDGCTFIGSVTGDKPDGYAHWRNKIQFTGTTRFYIDPNDPDLLQEIAGGNPDAQDWQDAILGMVPEDIEELEKSSILMPGWSADVGNFTNEQDVDPTLTPKVKLKGTIVAGILDVRGTADVFGTLLMTFRPEAGVGPLFYGGLTDAFNTTIGYFGPSDGDGEGVDTDDANFVGFGEITLRYDPDAKLPDGIPWPISINADPLTYTEGGSM
ncbi:MAG: hypothetical protein IH830_01150 [Planctomycetes bacterium]|nr:hypothetical protein [Planctomycetota bacterium]